MTADSAVPPTTDRERAPLEVVSYDGASEAQVAHGDNCVSLMVRSRLGSVAGLVLAPDGARELAALLIAQADAAQVVRGAVRD